MKLQLLGAVAATALMAMPSIASADDNGWYLKGNAGYGIINDVDLTGGLIGDIEGEGNVAYGAGVGYDFGNNWRAELEGLQLWNDMGAIGQASNTKSSMRITPAMLNLIYDFEDLGDWSPYVGAGIGVAHAKMNSFVHGVPNTGFFNILNNVVCPTHNHCDFTDGDSNLAWQVLAGVGYDLSDNWTWDTNYRYMNIGDLDFNGTGANLQPPLLTTLGATNPLIAGATGADIHAVMTGLRYTFGAKAKEMAPPPPPPPPPPPAMETCWDGSQVSTLSACPPQITYTTCEDGTRVESGTACPVRYQTCWDGAQVTDLSQCTEAPELQQCADGTYTYDRASCVEIQALCSEQSRSEIIYYEFNKPQSPETEEKIRRILDTGQYCSVGNITVVGHTDSSGSRAYNQKLSEKRAADVRAELISRGINSGLIFSEGKGESQLFIDTGDGVKEQLNRRTEVLIRLDTIGTVTN